MVSFVGVVEMVFGGDFLSARVAMKCAGIHRRFGYRFIVHSYWCLRSGCGVPSCRKKACLKELDSEFEKLIAKRAAYHAVGPSG